MPSVRGTVGRARGTSRAQVRQTRHRLASIIHLEVSAGGACGGSAPVQIRICPAWGCCRSIRPWPLRCVRPRVGLRWDDRQGEGAIVAAGDHGSVVADQTRREVFPCALIEADALDGAEMLATMPRRASRCDSRSIPASAVPCQGARPGGFHSEDTGRGRGLGGVPWIGSSSALAAAGVLVRHEGSHGGGVGRAARFFARRGGHPVRANAAGDSDSPPGTLGAPLPWWGECP